MHVAESVLLLSAHTPSTHGFADPGALHLTPVLVTKFKQSERVFIVYEVQKSAAKHVAVFEGL